MTDATQGSIVKVLKQAPLAFSLGSPPRKVVFLSENSDSVCKLQS